MKRTITGWIRKDNLNNPFYLDPISTGIDTKAVNNRSWFKRMNISTNGLVRVKITVETVKPKKRPSKPLPCDFCGNVPTLMVDTDSFTLIDSFWYHCKHCGNTHPRAYSKSEALNAWNKLQKGKA